MTIRIFKVKSWTMKPELVSVVLSVEIVVEVSEFMGFWDDFYSNVVDIEEYDDVVHNFYDFQSKNFEEIFFEYYKILEILFVSDITQSSPKYNVFKKRTKNFFAEHNYPTIYTPIVDSLRKVKRQKAHEAFVDHTR